MNLPNIFEEDVLNYFRRHFATTKASVARRLDMGKPTVYQTLGSYEAVLGRLLVMA